jgi:hypothetical protein
MDGLMLPKIMCIDAHNSVQAISSYKGCIPSMNTSLFL